MNQELKLNKKRIYIIGFAFFAILMLWQAYNSYCPLFLKKLIGNEKYSSFIIGTIMALDNVAALVMLPFFGGLSDRTKSKYGKRMPYIIIGMALSIIVFPLIAVFYIKNSLVGVIIMMVLTLFIMQSYRNPAVALMPDITPKPLRSKANGIINLVGYIGGIFIGLVAMFFPIVVNGEYTNNKFFIYLPFILTSVCTLIAMIVLIFKINENKILEEMKDEMKIGEEMSETSVLIKEGEKLAPIDKRNFIILMISVFAWFMAFNAVETFNSIYFAEKFGESGPSGMVSNVLVISSIITFIPAGLIASKIGRKKSVVIGILCLTVGLASLVPYYFIKEGAHFLVVSYLSYVIAGIGWALINVNSYPMVVELAHSGNIGKYTGMYYTASMLAQSITPILIGAISTFIFKGEIHILYIYSTILSCIALIIFSFYKETKHSNIEVKKGLEAFDQD